MKLICWFRTMWLTGTAWVFGDHAFNAYISGCSWVMQEDGCLKCSVCGATHSFNLGK